MTSMYLKNGSARFVLVSSNPLTYSVEGILDEKFVYSQMSEQLQNHKGVCYFDIGKIERVNSRGIRLWVQFLKSISHCKVVYCNAPVIMMDQFLMVPEFLGEGSEIRSFEVNGYCSKCETLQPVWCSQRESDPILIPSSKGEYILRKGECVTCGAKGLLFEGDWEQLKGLVHFRSS
jgi:ABC-type transporter Mla MlaB component